MNSLSFKAKILILVIVPLVLVSCILTGLSIYQAKQLGEQNLQNFSDKIFELRRSELKNYTELAITSVEKLYNDPTISEQEAQKKAKDILQDLAYGEDGYFFVYDYNGISVSHPKKPQIVGRNLWETKDANGVYLIQGLVGNAKNGGGYTEYLWDKPSVGKQIGKIGYALGLDRWQWMVGTGLYIDDLEDAIANVREKIDQSITKTWQLTIAISLGATLLVGVIGVRLTMSEGKLADQKLQQLSQKSVEAQESERSRVSRELQSGINQLLFSVRAKLHDIMKSEPVVGKAVLEDFSAAETSIDKAIEEVHRISGELRPRDLDELGVYAAVESLAQKITDESGINITYKQTDVNDRLHPEAETAIYRIVQESLKNMVVHSSATQASIRMRQTAAKLSITIRDNGVGFDSREMRGKGNKAGVGLVDMRVRAESLGGTFTVFASKGAGTTIKVELPA